MRLACAATAPGRACRRWPRRTAARRWRADSWDSSCCLAIENPRPHRPCCDPIAHPQLPIAIGAIAGIALGLLWCIGGRCIGTLAMASSLAIRHHTLRRCSKHCTCYRIFGNFLSRKIVCRKFRVCQKYQVNPVTQAVFYLQE
jgi:hypothetical protein